VKRSKTVTASPVGGESQRPAEQSRSGNADDPAPRGGAGAPQETRQETLYEAKPMRASRPARPDSRSVDTASWISLRWTRGTRYFRVHLEQDLWHGWLVTQINGRSDSRLGHHRAMPAASIEDAFIQLAAVAKRRRQRGYQLMS
jgi:hypothetical protein